MKNVFEAVKSINEQPFFSKLKTFFRKLTQNRFFCYVVFLYVIVFLMFLVTLIRNSFTIPMSGDFTLQQIPFYYNGYDDWWASLTSGKFVMWDDSAMLGVNNVGANSFYYLFNPFFLALLLVPRGWLIQAQAFMMMTKMVLAGVTMKLLLEKFRVKEETTWLFGIAYAFCGWNLYYLWFNHFLEIAVLVPLMLLGIEKIIKDQKPLLLIITIFITGLTNYFFLIAFCFIGAFYAIFRYFQNLKYYKTLMEEATDKRYQRTNVKIRMIDVRAEVILLGVFAFTCGLMLSAFVLFPCFSVALGNSRVTSQTYLTDLLDACKNLFGKGDLSFSEAIKNFFSVLFVWQDEGSKRLLYPLIGFLTPNFSCFDSAVIAVNSYDNTYASLFIFTPIMLFFIPSIISSLKKKKFSVLVGLFLCLLGLFTPFAYYCFSGFTSVAYARWYIFIIAFLIIFIAKEYDNRTEMKVYYLDISVAVVVFLFGLMLYKADVLYMEGANNLKDLADRRAYVFAELAYIIVMYLYLRKNYQKVSLTGNLRYFVALEAIVMCNITVLMGQGTVSYSSLYGGPNNFREEMALADTIKKEDDTYFRIFSTSANRDNNNFAMMMGTPGVGTFHSIYDTNLDDFLSWSDVKYNGSWSMGIHEKRINLDEFLGIKYYILKDDDNNIPFGFNEYLSTDDHSVYRNENYIELGYAFDNIVPARLMTDDTVRNENAYLKGAVMYEDDLEALFGEDYQNNSDFNVLNVEDISSDYTSIHPSSSQTKIYKAVWENGSFTGYEEPIPFSTSATHSLTWNSYIDIDTSSYKIGADCATRGKCYVTVQARMGENLDITLYGRKPTGEEYVITHDTHMVQWYARSNGEWKKERGFYVDDQVTRIKIQVNETMNQTQYLMWPDITYEYEDAYLANLQPLKENQFTNIEHDINYFAFDTNYESPKIVVLQIPYDKGWSLERYSLDGEKLSSPDIYQMQGGFIGFICDEGNYHYELKYYTPELKKGGYLTAAGIALIAIYQVITINNSYDKRKLAFMMDDCISGK